MKIKVKSVIILGLCCASLLLCCACKPSKVSKNTDVTLRLVVEEGEKNSSESYRTAEIESCVEDYNRQTSTVAKIEIERIPINPDERKSVIKRLSVEIMSGMGPDIFLLPTKTVIYDSRADPTMVFSSLFQDVEQSMYSGLFFDISDYYDADKSLEKDNLNQDVMAGGCIGHSRYILPMQYSIPILIADTKTLNDLGLNVQSLSIMDDYLSAIANSNNPDFATDFQGTFLSAFPELFDYENEKVLLDEGSITKFSQNYQKFMTLRMNSSVIFPPNVLQSYLETGEFWVNEDTPFRNTILGNYLLDSIAMSKVLNKDIAVIPLKSSDGSLVANINFWGAVSSNCEHPKEAYDFLSGFLSKSKQFNSDFRSVYDGWPVYTSDSVETLWEIDYSFLQSYGTDLEKSLSKLVLVDDDMPVLREKIDCVRYETALDDKFTYSFLSQLIDWNTKTAANADTRELSQNFLDEMRFHICE